MSDKESKNNDHEAATATVPCFLGVTKHEVHNAEQLPTLLAHIFTEGRIAGIVWATNGTRSVNGLNPASPGQGATLKVSSPDGLDISQVYEARIRWVNGVGAVELTLTTNTAKASSEGSESGTPCVSGWAHKVSYLQHESTASGDADFTSDPTSGQEEENQQRATTKQMTAVEFIREEDKYGNTVVVDQLFTGE